MENTFTYEDAFNELQTIVSSIESGEINVDELSDKIKRASELISLCKAKLTASEEEVDKLLIKLEKEDTILNAEEGGAEEE
ncbi:exodeoxyribonuclease VII small subunit [Sphingobacterium hungaricum]|uniref:Exodeoxyribonuclease 7 small subunit n=1 Tax=Sphingobacterium hungaricum TaxID=2082723 RepID=A0A928YPM6_9SPHI|nr:exodeoxyribonuclease VII small subunit [Sphingobacterium hungaricum]MBE8713069.1 exodeoxyribonuclease VII small subunit [Sphingobacterium hungaricum]